MARKVRKTKKTGWSKERRAAFAATKKAGLNGKGPKADTLDSRSLIPADAPLQFIEGRPKNFERDNYDSRGSVFEHLAHVMMVQADTVKTIANAAVQAPAFQNKARRTNV